LIYYISRPLVGSWEEVRIPPAVLPPSEGSGRQLKATPETRDPSGSPRKKDIRSFHELLNHFPAIAKQMQAGLEKLFREFTQVFERPLPPPPSAKDIPDPEPEGPITAAAKRARSGSDVSVDASAAEGANGSLAGAADDEEVMRTSLETAVTAAIDLFQGVDRQQLSLLAATTDLTGSVVERLIERYIAENVHHLLFPRLAALRRQDDLELEAKIRQMDFIDISQLGIVIDGGNRAKRDLVSRLGRAVEEFRKMPNATSPQEMMGILLSTTKAAIQFTDAPQPGEPPGPSSEKPVMTVNADTLVSLLLYVVIKAQIKHLQARLTYVRHFIFIDDVDSGEMGYALSTFEAVLSYLDRESGGLRRASRRNRALWDAVSKGDISELKKIMEPDEDAIEDDPNVFGSSSRRPSSSGWSFTNGSSRRSSSNFTASETFSMGSGLSHVFPFQNGADTSADDGPIPPVKRTKKVAMDTRSMSSGSEISFRSMPLSLGTFASAIEGDTSIERLAQTQDASGESVVMMAIQNRRPEALRYLLSLRQYYPAKVIMDDQNNEGTTLFSAAVQLGDETIVNMVLDFLLDSADDSKIRDYLAIQDTWGRSAAHYMFHAPFLIQRIGRLLPWRQKDRNGQTPLFALCRSYDHPNYHTMVEEALEAATRSQGDGQPLHLDNHVDVKGNTLLHIVNDASLALQILQKCDVDVNATNEKKFTALMLASKYGRFDMVRTLFSDPRVDIAAREARGLTAVELAKDDELRNKIDDLVLFSLGPGPDARTTGVVRSFFVEDASIRFVLKSGAPIDEHNYAVTTCRRSLTDFEHLTRLLQMENPASWIPSLADLRSPIQIPSRPSRAVLKDLQVRMDWFLRVLLAHPTFSTHEMLWEFFLVPDLQLDMMAERSKLKADALMEKVHEEYEPVEDLREVEQFVDHARDMVRSVHFSTRSVARRASALGNVVNGKPFLYLAVSQGILTYRIDLYESSYLLSKSVSSLAFLPISHISAFDAYVRSLAPSQSSPYQTFFQAFLALYNNVEAILKALARPPQTIAKIVAVRRDAERSYSSLSRSSRWPLGLLDETRQRLNEEREEKARRSEGEAQTLARELRYAQQTVAGELAGWRDMHERLGRRAIKDLARGMLIAEKARLEGLKRALRAVREGEGNVDSLHVGGHRYRHEDGEGARERVGVGGVGRSPLVDGETAAEAEIGEAD
jgi:ankyrin repeat protein